MSTMNVLIDVRTLANLLLESVDLGSYLALRAQFPEDRLDPGNRSDRRRDLVYSPI